MSEIPEDVWTAAVRAADKYRADTGDNAFCLTFDRTMRLLSAAIMDERERCASLVERLPSTAGRDADGWALRRAAQAIRHPQQGDVK